MNNSSAQTNTLAPPLDIELFRRLSEADGPSGFEGEIREILRHRFAEAGGEILEDRLGGVIGVRRGTADRPRIMLDCHTDEVGFIVRHITKDGFLRFLPLGSWPGDVLSAERVRVMASGGKISGMIGAIPPHHRTGKTALPALESLYIDIGAESRDQVESWGIRIGTPIVPATPFQLMRNPRRALGKAFDNRAGCALCVEAFQRAAGFA